ncbi:hypothetical protein P4O66_019956 [Electrophorus voltai]|uniref:Uncharacterized protein n=1 Tax=Electrophorus voltai TaxID=2609070 RepID=A0AAD8YNX3_9TELE|nr:hypothetical protein P4O66_019956 [Electrophorus voltai]
MCPQQVQATGTLRRFPNVCGMPVSIPASPLGCLETLELFYTNQELYWQQVYWEWYMQTYYSHLSSLQQWHMACHQNHMQNMAKQKRTTPPPQLRKRKRKDFSGDEGSFSHSSSESEAYADEGQPPSKKGPRENLFGLLKGIPGILDLAAEMGFSWISLSQPWNGNDLHWLKLMRTSFRFSDEESESDDASMAASMDSEGEVAFVHGIDAGARYAGTINFYHPTIYGAPMRVSAGRLASHKGSRSTSQPQAKKGVSIPSPPTPGEHLPHLSWATTSCQSKEDKISSGGKSIASPPATAQEDRCIKIYLGLAKPSAIGDLWRKDHLRSHVFPPSVAEERYEAITFFPPIFSLYVSTPIPFCMRNAGLHTSESPRLPGNIGAYYTNQELYWQQVYWEWYMQTYYSHLSSLEQWHMACHQNHLQNMAKEQPTTPPPQLRKRKRKAFSGDEGSFSHSSSESEAHADEGQPPSKRPRKNLFREEPLVCDAVVTKEGEVFFSDQILGLLEGIPRILDLVAEMGFSV